LSGPVSINPRSLSRPLCISKRRSHSWSGRLAGAAPCGFQGADFCFFVNSVRFLYAFRVKSLPSSAPTLQTIYSVPTFTGPPRPRRKSHRQEPPMSSSPSPDPREIIRQEWRDAAPFWRKWSSQLAFQSRQATELVVEGAALSPGLQVLDL